MKTATTFFFELRPRDADLRRWIFVLLLSGALAVTTAGFGFAIAVFTALGALALGQTTTLATWLLGASLLLLSVVAHCLDKVREIERTSRLEHCGRFGC